MSRNACRTDTANYANREPFVTIHVIRYWQFSSFVRGLYHARACTPCLREVPPCGTKAGGLPTLQLLTTRRHSFDLTRFPRFVIEISQEVRSL
jgi:hypothetical protein